MSDNAKRSKSIEETNPANNRPGTSANADDQPRPTGANALFWKAFRLGRRDRHENPQPEAQRDPNQKDQSDAIAGETFEELLTRCDRHYAERQIDVLFPSQFDSLSPSIRTLKQSQSCFSESALKCFLLQSVSRPDDSRWDRTRFAYSKIDTATQSTPPEPATIENATIVSTRETTSAEVQISPSLIPPRPILGEPPLEGAPPTYSAVMRIGPTRSPRRLFGGRRVAEALEPSAPFITPTPPPTYAEAQGHYYRPVLVDSDLLWGPDPMPAACQRCGTYVITQTTNQRSNMTHFAALALCICGCWPCCLLPYCMNSCKNTYHYCPNCNSYLGMYRPWN